MMLAPILLAVLPVFSHLSLADAQRLTVAQSVDVQVARATVRQRESALEIARSGGVPHLSGNYALAPQAGPFDQSVVEQHIFTVAAGISIDDILSAPMETRAAAGDLLAAQRDEEATALQAKQRAVKLYFTALQASALESTRADALRGAQRDRQVAALRSRYGDAARLDVMRADVSVAQAQADLVRATADRANAVDALASATGVDPGAIATGNAGSTTALTPLDEARAVARALADRPEIASLLAAIDARTASVGAARAGSWPTLTASGGYAAGVDSGQAVRGPAANVTLDVPLAPATGARVSAARAQADIARAQLADARRTIALEAASAVRDVRAERQAAEAAIRANDEAARALAAVEIGYREGASSSLEVADARRVSTQAAVDALVARYRAAQAEALLEIIAP